jgi:hypothetical protein
VGLLTGLLLLPLAPIRATVWLAERLLDEAERELADPALVEQWLVEAEEAHERGELTEEELDAIEVELLSRLTGQGGL